MVSNPSNPSKVAEHGGSSDNETKIPLILSSGGLASSVRGTVVNDTVFNKQIAVSALDALGLDASKLQGAKTAGTLGLPKDSIDASLLINDSALYENGLQAFQEYNPIRDKFYGATGDNRTANERQLYRNNTFGSDAATFVLDARSFRDQELDAVADPTNATQVGQFPTRSTALSGILFFSLRRKLVFKNYKEQRIVNRLRAFSLPCLGNCLINTNLVITTVTKK